MSIQPTQPTQPTQNRRVGITTTVPVEVIYAGGWTPVDLNNVFVSHAAPVDMVEQAEAEGLPRNTCSWIKGIYAVAKQAGLDAVIGCIQGDCSNTQALMENWVLDGVSVVPFEYPHDRDSDRLMRGLDALCEAFGTTMAAAEEQKARLDSIREKALTIDALTWRGGKVTGRENHLWLVSCSDFGGDPDQYARDCDEFLDQARARAADPPPIRLGYVGVPPVCPELYDFVEELGGRVVFNEVQRQFAMPGGSASLLEQYRSYTYPYDVFGRVADVREQLRLRHIHGLIHYVQSFCYRQLQDRVLRKKLDVPILTLEFDRPGPLDGATMIRVEAFLEMLRDRQTR